MYSMAAINVRNDSDEIHEETDDLQEDEEGDHGTDVHHSPVSTHRTVNARDKVR